MNHALTWTAAILLVYAALRPRLEHLQVSAALFFTAAGFLVGPVLGAVHLDIGSEDVKTLAEATLVLVLFTDASRISLRELRRERGVPERLLGIGLPLTLVVGTVAAIAVLPSLTMVEALLLAVMLSCTDAALGKAVVTDPRVPSAVRQGLNVESGLNDGLCVPIFLVALTAAEAEQGALGDGEAMRVVAEQLGFGACAGVLSALLGVLALRLSRPPARAPWGQILPVSVALLSAGLAHAWGGSIFIAAFVAGAVTAFVPSRDTRIDEHTELLEEGGEVLNAITFAVFGAVVLEPALQAVTWPVLAYAVLSLTVARMLPVALAMARSGASRSTVAYLGWFGPRGLASVVFAVMLVDADLEHESLIVTTVSVTVALSVLLHGLTAGPLTDRYVAAVSRAAPRPRPRPSPETAEVQVPRWRAARTRT